MKKFLLEAKGHLMTGIGYMLPLIIGASLVVAIPTLIALACGVTSLSEDMTGFFKFLWQVQQVGWTGIGLVNTVLAGFIAYSIADKPAIGAGFIAGAIASTTKAGFLGAILYAFIAGYLVRWAINQIKLEGSFATMMPLVILPFLATGVVAIIAVILSDPLSAINLAIVDYLKGLAASDSSRVLMAVILGGMIAFDMGGPVNKAAWMSGNILLLEGIYTPAVFINCAIVIPPLAYAIAPLIHKNRFSTEMKDASIGNWVMGFIGITEGAIPFTLIKPTRLIPVNIIGGALGAALCALMGGDAVIPPLGGCYGFITMVNPLAYIAGILAGSLFIAIVAPLVADFNVNPEESMESVAEEDIEISFE